MRLNIFECRILGSFASDIGFYIIQKNAILGQNDNMRNCLYYFSITWVFTPYNTCLPEGMWYPHLTVWQWKKKSEARESSPGSVHQTKWVNYCCQFEWCSCTRLLGAATLLSLLGLLQDHFESTPFNSFKDLGIWSSNCYTINVVLETV